MDKIIIKILQNSGFHYFIVYNLLTTTHLSRNVAVTGLPATQVTQ